MHVVYSWNILGIFLEYFWNILGISATTTAATAFCNLLLLRFNPNQDASLQLRCCNEKKFKLKLVKSECHFLLYSVIKSNPFYNEQTFIFPSYLIITKYSNNSKNFKFCGGHINLIIQKGDKSVPGLSISSVSFCLLKGSVFELRRWRPITERSMMFPLGNSTGSNIIVFIRGSVMKENQRFWNERKSRKVEITKIRDSKMGIWTRLLTSLTSLSR